MLHPALLYRDGITTVEHFQEIKTILRMTIALVMPVHIVKRYLQRIQRLLVASMFVQIAPYRYVSACKLVNISILSKFL